MNAIAMVESDVRFDTLAEWLQYCERLHPKEIDLTLDRVLEVRNRLELNFSVPVISVAGTNGKGSTCAMLDSIARAAGLKVGLYSKPHLCHFEERCRLNGVPVRGDELLPHFEAVEGARGEVSLSYFEHTTLAIMRLLSQSDVDLVILEVGLGGRLDAVNVIDADCAVITGIDIDHTEYLGDTREAIGFEKAGIMRPGRPVVVGELNPPLSVQRAASKVGADLKCRGSDFDIARDDDQWTWKGWTGRLDGLPLPALRGQCQIDNAATAIAALEAMAASVPISNPAVRRGLRDVRLSGRFEVIPGEPTFILDVAHNVQSVRELALNLQAETTVGRTAAIFGCMHDKDISAILDIMDPVVDVWHLTDLPLPRAEKAGELVALLLDRSSVKSRLVQHAKPADAVHAVLKEAPSVSRVVVFGSFYTVGGVMSSAEFQRHLLKTPRS